MTPRTLLTILLALSSLLLSRTALAQTQIAIDYNTPAFAARKLEAKPISVVVSYEPIQPGQADSIATPNLRYQIAYNGTVKVNAGEQTFSSANVSLQDLDSDRSAEVIVSTFTGGAHCCTNFKIYSWQKGQFLATETGLHDGMGGSFRALDRTGKVMFVTYDNAFLYAFSSYAGSYPPSEIYAFQQGRFQNVTHRYPKELRATLQAMYKAFQERKRQGGEINGILAGYVAQKILLGEYQQGWAFMLANYNKQDWAAWSENGGKRRVDFPTALKAFLIKDGYLTAQGQPVSRVTHSFSLSRE